MPLDMSDIKAELRKDPPHWTDWALPLAVILFVAAGVGFVLYSMLVAARFIQPFL